MPVNVKNRFSYRSPIASGVLLVALSTLSLAGCSQTPASDEDAAEVTVIDRSDVDEASRGVTIYSEEELRRTGKPDAGTALKKLDPRIN